MIGWLSGKLVARLTSGEIIVDVAGVGYRVSVPTPALGRWEKTGASVTLHVHTHVREGDIVLYGFPTLEERETFEALVATHGVGPALALSILSTLGPSELATAILEEDVGALCEVPGVGRKTAARLVIELGERLGRLQMPVQDSKGGRAPANTRSEVRAALAELGYGPEEIRQAVAELPEEASIEEALRMALREMAGSR